MKTESTESSTSSCFKCLSFGHSLHAAVIGRDRWGRASREVRSWNNRGERWQKGGHFNPAVPQTSWRTA